MLSDDDIKADIMNKLMRKGCWGAKYIPLDSLVHWLSKKIKKDGKRIRRIIRDMDRDGYILIHKEGKVISLNPALSKEISEYIERMMER